MNAIMAKGNQRNGYIVLSASRRTDLVGCYPQVLIDRLEKIPPERIHTLVIWTKNPGEMIGQTPLRGILQRYRQIYLHLTITGMGGGEFEPRIPPWEKTVEMIGPLLNLVGDPQRISWRFDPILEVKGAGRSFSNFPLFPVLAEATAQWGIRTCRVSWVSPYKKVTSRLAGQGWQLLPRSVQERAAQAKILSQVADRHGMNLFFCSMDGFPSSACIDGRYLSEIHPQGLGCAVEKDQGQRRLCGCTESWDIGWYSLRCQHGCLYCYATP